MIEAWSTDAVYAAEGALMATLDDGELMARAVEGLAGVAAARLEESGGESVAALVGPGNNGADALYAVARLAEAGWNAAAVHHDHVHEGARAAAEAAGVVLTTDPSGLGEADVVLDGILGIGARPGLPDWAVGWLAALSETAHVIAVDLPSGQDPMGGELDPDGVFADETVTFSVAKPVHLLPPTEQACGLLTVVDIGLEVDADPVVRRLDHDDVAALWPVPVASDDKYSRGVLGVIAGGESYSGAAVLSVTAAVEAGCGMVRYVGTPTPTGLVRAAVPEAVHGAGRVQAWLVGPGLDVARGRRARRPSSTWRARRSRAPSRWSSTPVASTCSTPRCSGQGGCRHPPHPARGGVRPPPHPARCGAPSTTHEVTREQVEARPLAHARALAALTGATVLLKGATTLVVPPGDGSTAWSQCDAPPWLATAGAGDVLAGLLGTLLAAGLPADVAGALGALVHGVAADRANPGGPVRALAVAHGIPGQWPTCWAAPAPRRPRLVRPMTATPASAPTPAPAGASAWVDIDLDAIRDNVAELARRAGSAQVMAVVKGDAYGHGLVPSARAALAGGATWLGVAQLAEALDLRRAGVTAPLLTWLFPPGADVGGAIDADIEVTVGSGWTLDAVVAAARERGRPARVQVKVDTGLGRGGILTDWSEMVARVAAAQAEGAVEVTGVWSHFAWADAPQHPTVRAQQVRFVEAADELDGPACARPCATSRTPRRR